MDKVVALIVNRDRNKCLGTGFFFGDKTQLITCRHVVKNNYTKSEQVNIFYKNQWFTGTLEKVQETRDEKNDLALIRVECIGNMEIKYLSQVGHVTKACTEIKCKTHGYPKGFTIENFQKNGFHEPDLVCTGFGDPNLIFAHANGIKEGFSGAPIVTPENVVIGIVCAIERPGSSFHGINRAFGIPVHRLLDFLDDNIKKDIKEVNNKKDIKEVPIAQPDNPNSSENTKFRTIHKNVTLDDFGLSPEEIINMGNAHKNNKEYDQAIRCYMAAEKTKKDKNLADCIAQCYMAKAAAEHSTEYYPSIFEWLKKTTGKCDANNFFLNEGEKYKKENKYKDAIVCYEYAAKLSDDGEAELRLAILYKNQGDNKEAVEWIDKSAKKNNKEAENKVLIWRRSL